MWDIAYAQAAPGATGPGPVMYLFPFVLIFIIMYFVVIRPQQKKAKDHHRKGMEMPQSPRTAGSLLIGFAIFFIVMVPLVHERAPGERGIILVVLALGVFCLARGIYLLTGSTAKNRGRPVSKVESRPYISAADHNNVGSSFCRKCGERLEQGDKFCAHCGAEVR